MTERPAAPVLQVVQGRRGVATLVTVRATDLADLQDELTALVGEGSDRQVRALAMVRQAQCNLARGWSAGTVLDALERDLVRWGDQLAAAAANARADAICPDGETARHIGHGRAA